MYSQHEHLPHFCSTSLVTRSFTSSTLTKKTDTVQTQCIHVVMSCEKLTRTESPGSPLSPFTPSIPTSPYKKKHICTDLQVHTLHFWLIIILKLKSLWTCTDCICHLLYCTFIALICVTVIPDDLIDFNHTACSAVEIIL